MLPPLYKFRTVNDYTLESLREGYVYFSNPTTFNDPFELSVYIDATRPVAKIVLGNQEIILLEGEWSEWVTVEFELLPYLQTLRAPADRRLRESREPAARFPLPGEPGARRRDRQHTRTDSRLRHREARQRQAGEAARGRAARPILQARTATRPGRRWQIAGTDTLASSPDPRQSPGSRS